MLPITNHDRVLLGMAAGALFCIVAYGPIFPAQRLPFVFHLSLFVIQCSLAAILLIQLFTVYGNLVQSQKKQR